METPSNVDKRQPTSRTRVGVLSSNEETDGPSVTDVGEEEPGRDPPPVQSRRGTTFRLSKGKGRRGRR